MELRALRRGGLVVLPVGIIAGAAVLFGVRAAPTRPPVAAAAPAVRIRVQVLNATSTRGLARRATGFLRDRGFDVVDVGTSRESRDTTLVLDRSGNPALAQLVARALNGAPVESRPDSSRYLDVTVLVGRDWTSPAEPFYP